MKHHPNTKGLLIVNTGNGKGKTTAALGLGLRAAGQGFKVLIIQFIKDEKSRFGEHLIARKIPNFFIEPKGLGFVGILGDKRSKKVHEIAAQRAFNRARELIIKKKFPVVILDEIFNALNLNLITLPQLLDLIKNKPPSIHLVLTGRGAPQEILDLADMVTEMKEIKHHYQNGVPAQRGIEY